ncbi:MAG: hypothetical protein HW410_1742 [Nitrosarchaeum sp.]|nr:hypothetical protein [Nitrosarchaeum sp.]
MKYLVLLLILIGFVGTSYGFEPAMNQAPLSYFGYFDDHGDKVTELVVGEEYFIKAKFFWPESYFQPYEFFAEINDDKNNKVIERLSVQGAITPNTELEIEFSWTPKETGKFRNFSELWATDKPFVIIGVPQYDLVVSNDNASNRIPGGNFSPDKTVYPVPWENRSPLKQFKSGTRIDQIQCKEGLAVVLKASNGHPNCVKHETLEKLRERGWAEPLGDIVFQRPTQSKPEDNGTLSESDYDPHSPRCGSGVVPYIPKNWQATGKHPSDETWEALGNYLMKQEFYKELQQRNIIFEPACFGVYTGFADAIYPPRFSMCTVVTAIYMEALVREFDVTNFEINNEIPYQCDENYHGCLCGIENEN